MSAIRPISDLQFGVATAGEAHDNRLVTELLSDPNSGAMLLADRGYDADWIARSIAQSRTRRAMTAIYRASCTLLRKRWINRSMREDQPPPSLRTTSRIRCLTGSTKAAALARNPITNS
jgi:hypothetical protein